MRTKTSESSTQPWRINNGGSLVIGEIASGEETGVIAVGTVTPTAESGWIELRGGEPGGGGLGGHESGTLEESARRAAALTEVLETLRGKYPGFRWFVKG